MMNRNYSYRAYKVFYEKLEKINFRKNCVRNSKGTRNPIQKKNETKDKNSDSTFVRSKVPVFKGRNSQFTQEKGNKADSSQFSEMFKLSLYGSKARRISLSGDKLKTIESTQSQTKCKIRRSPEL